jgi:hypothetical protein
MVDGSSGVGKSTGIAYYLSELLKIDGDIVISTSTLKDRFEALGKTLKSNSIATNTILEAIYGGKKTNKVYTVNTYVKEGQTKKGSHVLLQEDFKLPEKFPESLKSVFGNDPSKVVLFIDEITLLHAGELKIFSEFAKKFGITLQGLGDLKQPSAKFSNDLTAGLENFVYTKGPSLKASLRITNKGMRRNKTIIEGLLDDVLDAYALHPE